MKTSEVGYDLIKQFEDCVMASTECAMCGGKGHTAKDCPWRRDRRLFWMLP